MPDVEIANSWVAVITGVLALAVTIGSFVFRLGRLRQEMYDSFRGQGERLGTVELNCASYRASIEELRRVDQRHEFQILELTKDLGEINGKLDRIKDSLRVQAENKSRGEMEVTDRLARIEERLNVFIDLHKGGKDG